MKKTPSPAAKKTKQKTRRQVDKIAAELAEVKARKIPAKELVWTFRLTASNDLQLQAAEAACVEFLIGELGKRCRVAMETATVARKKLLNFVLKPTTVTLELLCNIDRGMTECCQRTKVKYHFLGYGEEVYKYDSWKTLGTVLKPVTESLGDLDCRNVRFDGLYCHKTGDTSGYYLRFYPDGQCIAVRVSGGDAENVARWFTRDWKGAAIGSYKVKGSSLSAVIEHKRSDGQESTIVKLKGRLTKQGLKVRTWNSYTKQESPELYAFHNVKLK